MKVLHLLWHGDVGGAERALFQLVAAQAGDGRTEPGVLFGRGGGTYAQRIRGLGVPVTELGLSSAAHPAVLRRAPAAMAGWDVHHFHSAEPGLMAASLRTPGAPVRVFTNRGGTGREHWTVRQRIRHAAVGRMLRRFEGLSGNTAHAAAVASRRYGIPPERFSVTPNGLDFGLLVPDRTPRDIRDELGVAPGDVLVGTAAVLRSLKRVDRLLEAVALVREGRAVALVVGDGPDRPRLEELARRMHVSDRVRWTGMLESVASHVAAMDVFVMTSGERESFGNALVEAMALGVPSIVFADAAAMREHVRDGVTGLVVEDPPGLARAIEDLAGDRARARAIAEAGREEVRSRYGLRAMVDGYEALYASALAAGRNRR